MNKSHACHATEPAGRLCSEAAACGPLSDETLSNPNSPAPCRGPRARRLLSPRSGTAPGHWQVPGSGPKPHTQRLGARGGTPVGYVQLPCMGRRQVWDEGRWGAARGPSFKCSHLTAECWDNFCCPVNSVTWGLDNE